MLHVRRFSRWFVILISAVTLAAIGTVVPHPARGATLLWSDEFTGPSGASPASSKWNWETGGGGWGNNEWQTYTSSRSNSYLDGNGRLVIAVRGDTTGITSARMNTFGKFSLTFGTVSARIKLPAGQGLLPAFWLMGTDIYSAGWPKSGEIDVIEAPNNALRYNTTVHGPTTSGGHWQRGVSGSLGVDLAAGYHVYSVTKSRGRLVMKIDDRTVATFTSSQLSSGQQWVFDKPTYVLFTLAVGGNWPGAPDATTPNPSYLLVDWIRAYSS
ncbi:glycoside hydrolase family 16 [Gordonia bronchialis DSM 43247]|uniref:Glycoside hydrolase family 16 n=1 Tax=Gordonia bronchialis (strain ATCC 25592 / DSM 43247 / BCRC 13721 / JCM 3198 / KCTC 3076 / NBRC 16047 / NCTC 10667) TaxID=526226 RepID=D0L551_GORB4|nr:glycoside hydrolase family 16 protein [Gordonia bronchialis]ACY23309.1 glycoside hydrolase family 16 [Gordonia bronchialis DSM 43247]MCC3321475.1 glycoside hydrolase family 16 protein [Gordonia bronchialis]QGS23306.1 family 16 glycosylhydrolase [Gordonia bronchialis]STQ66285.1 Beta-glucanase precursor [Gordonia bronchialis]